MSAHFTEEENMGCQEDFLEFRDEVERVRTERLIQEGKKGKKKAGAQK